MTFSQSRKTKPIQTQYKPKQSQSRNNSSAFTYPKYYMILFLEGNIFLIFLLFVYCGGI